MTTLSLTKPEPILDIGRLPASSPTLTRTLHLQVREALLVERRRYREEHEAHQMAQSDLAELTQRYDNLLKRLNSRPPPSDTKAASTADDPIVLRVALNKCR